jgi:hypothetical protein
MKGSPINRIGSSVIIKTVDDGVGLVTLHYWKLELQVWHRDLNCHDVAAWVLFKKADLHSILGSSGMRDGQSQQGDMVYLGTMRMTM